MSDTTLQHLFRSLEHTIRERLDGIQEVIRMMQRTPGEPQQSTEYSGLLKRVQILEGRNQVLESTVNYMKGEFIALREKNSSQNEVLPLHPIAGIEVIPKREVVIPDEAEPLSVADRLLLNKKARKALEAEEMGETVEKPLLEEEEVVEEEEGEVEEEEEEEVEEEAEEAEELEEFEYKGSTYYRDGENNVFMTDSDGELVEQPIGTWNPVKQRIVMTKV